MHELVCAKYRGYWHYSLLFKLIYPTLNIYKKTTEAQIVVTAIVAIGHNIYLGTSLRFDNVSTKHFPGMVISKTIPVLYLTSAWDYNVTYSKIYTRLASSTCINREAWMCKD